VTATEQLKAARAATAAACADMQQAATFSTSYSEYGFAELSAAASRDLKALTATYEAVAATEAALRAKFTTEKEK
jgi:hypothetical protein